MATPSRAGLKRTRKKETTPRAPRLTDSTSAVAGDEASSDCDNPAIEHEEISRLAYSYWEARGFSGGSAEEDWYRAEEELKKPAMKSSGRQAAATTA
jgi:hypothetical protein